VRCQQPLAKPEKTLCLTGRHVTGELPASEFKKVLQGLQQQLDTEHQALAGGDEAAAAAADSSRIDTSDNLQWPPQGPSHGLQDALLQNSELLGSTEELKQAVERARAYLSSRQHELAGIPARDVAQQQQQQQLEEEVEGKGYQNGQEQTGGSDGVYDGSFSVEAAAQEAPQQPVTAEATASPRSGDQLEQQLLVSLASVQQCIVLVLVQSHLLLSLSTGRCLWPEYTPLQWQ
jgi:hypothetical protein